MNFNPVGRSPRSSDMACQVPTSTLAPKARGTFTSKECRCDCWVLRGMK